MVRRRALIIALLAVALLSTPVVPVTHEKMAERTEPLFRLLYDGETYRGLEYRGRVIPGTVSELERAKTYGARVSGTADLTGKVALGTISDHELALCCVHVTVPIDTKGKRNLTVEGTVSVAQAERAGTLDFFVFDIGGASSHYTFADPVGELPFYAASDLFNAYYLNWTLRWVPETIVEVRGVEVGGPAHPEERIIFSFPVNETDYYMFFLATSWLRANITVAAQLRYSALTKYVTWVSPLALLYEYVSGRA